MAPNNKKKKATAVKIKKKRWFPIHAPALFGEKLLGETYTTEATNLQGKYLTANLSTITGSMRKQTMNLQFRVNRVADGKGYTEIVGYSLINAAMKRLVRRGRDKIADSFLAKTSDMKVVRIKPVIITHNHGTKSVQSAVRLQARKFIREYMFTKTAEELFGEIADGKIQKLIKDAVAKIFPLRSVDIRMAKLDETGKVNVTDKAVESEKVNIRVKDKGERYVSAAEKEEAAKRKSQSVADDDGVTGTSVNLDDEEEAQDFDDEESSDEFGDDDDFDDEEEVSDEELEADLDDEDRKKLEDA